MTNKKRKLTPKEEFFIKEYLVDFNGARAARDSGFSKRSARQLAVRMLSKDYIQDEIQTLMAEKAKKIEYDAEYVLNGLAEIHQMHKIPNPAPAVRALELLGKHNLMFTDKLMIGGDEENPVGFIVHQNGKTKTVGNRVRPDTEADGGDELADGQLDD